MNKVGSSFLLPVWKTNKADVGTENFMLGQYYLAKGGEMKFEGFRSLQLPEMQRTNRLGYNLLNLVGSDGLLMIDNDDIVYDSRNDKTWKLTAFKSVNNVGQEVFTSLSPSFKHLVLDLKRVGENIWILFTEDGKLAKAVVKPENGELKTISQTVILETFPTENDRYPALFIDKKIALFDKDAKSFVLMKE